MARTCVPVACLVILTMGAGDLSAEGPSVSLWAVDPLIKVFPDMPATQSGKRVEIYGGANEYISGQVAVRADRELRGVSAHWGPLHHRESAYTIPPMALRWRFAGFIPIERNTPNTAPGNLLRAAPCEIPDPLLEVGQIDLPASRTQPIWLTVFVPPDARPGEYEGRFSVGNNEVSQSIEVWLSVYPFVLPEERHLWVTNWFSAGQIARFHKVAPWSEEHWSLLERYAENMAAHRQNVVLTPISLIKVIREPDGKLSFDYADFDRWVLLFEKAGACGRIEIGHVAHHGRGGWGSKEIVLQTVSALDRGTGEQASLGPDEGLAPLLRNLQRHLAERGWLDKTMIHVADEPSLHNIEPWRRASDFVHHAAPGLRRIDAIETRDFTGYLEIWVPKLNYLPGWLDDYRAAQLPGDELWFYTCLHPQGYFPNRLLDYPLVATRILHWINWRHRLDGFLHWGWNHWTDNPFENPGDRLPPGDSFIVYPGRDGPLDSIRWEMMREGIQDYEEFRLLAEKTRRVIERLGKAASHMNPRQRSDEICRRIARSCSDYEKDPAAFGAGKRMLLEEITAIERPPLAVVATVPPAQTELVPGPIVVEVYGVVEKGTSVKVDGRAVEVKPDGRFIARAAPWANRQTIEIIVEHNSRSKTLRRHFQVKPL